MFRSELDYSTCTDPACQTRVCTPCRLGVCSSCKREVTCPTTREQHPCRCTRRTAP